MNKYVKVLMDLKEIIESIPEVSYVSLGKPRDVNVDTNVPSVYINPLNGIFENTKNTKCISGYDTYELVRIIVNMECKDELDWVYLRDTIIDAVLKDSAIWKNLVDRDVINWANDDYDNMPRKQFEIGFELRIRA